MVEFVRRIWSRYSKLGKRRKKKQIWRKPTGRDNKMREKRRGYPAVVSIGYSKNKKIKGKIQGKEPVIVSNVGDLEKIKKNQIIILGRMGKKKKIELVKKAKKKDLEIYNLNIKKFLKKNIKQKKNESK
jgi:large subunit ribosomal protein L32e